MILPVAVIVAGLAGAFSTQAMGKKGALTNKWGYRHVSASQPFYAFDIVGINTIQRTCGASQYMRGG